MENDLKELTVLHDTVSGKDYILWSTGHLTAKDSIVDFSEFTTAENGGSGMGRNKEEEIILKKFAEGMLDGRVGDDLHTSGGSTVWTQIKHGIPTRYKQAPSKRFFNGKENEKVAGKLNILEQWLTDERKLEFVQKFGWLMKDQDVINYSAKYKP